MGVCQGQLFIDEPREFDTRRIGDDRFQRLVEVDLRRRVFRLDRVAEGRDRRVRIVRGGFARRHGIKIPLLK